KSSSQMSGARGSPALGERVGGHAREHGEHEDKGLAVARAERRDGRSGAKAREPPANAEHEGAGDEATVEVPALRQVHGAAEERLPAAAGQPEGEEADEDGARHDEGERRIPCPGKVEEADDLARVGHARKEEADAEYEAGGESGKWVHGRKIGSAQARRWRAT